MRIIQFVHDDVVMNLEIVKVYEANKVINFLGKCATSIKVTIDSNISEKGRHKSILFRNLTQCICKALSVFLTSVL